MAESHKMLGTLADCPALLHEAMILIFFSCHINENGEHPAVPDFFSLDYHFTLILRLK